MPEFHTYCNVLTGLKLPPNSLSRNGQLLFRCRVNTIHLSRVFGGGNAKAKAIAFANLFPLGTQRASLTPTMSFMYMYFQHDVTPFKLICGVVKFSTGCGPLLFKNGLTSFASTGTITAYRSKNIKPYQQEHLLVICGWYQILSVQHLATALFVLTCILCTN